MRIFLGFHDDTDVGRGITLSCDFSGHLLSPSEVHVVYYR